MKDPIKVGFCIAYDWYLLEYALPLIYAQADQICLSVDRDRISWSGSKYRFDDDAFYSLVKRIDVDGKIRVQEEDFHRADLSAGENEIRQRNSIALFLGMDGWHIQLDCDEYFYDFSSFVHYLRSLPKTGRTFNICCPLATLYKQVPGGFLYVNPLDIDRLEFIQIAMREPLYEYGRRNGYFNVYTNFAIIHQSWARTSEEIHEKINNWGHVEDFDKGRYFLFWDSLSERNYMVASNFHFLKPEVWPKLSFIEAAGVREFVERFGTVKFPKLSKINLFIKNSLWLSRLRRVLKMIGV